MVPLGQRVEQPMEAPVMAVLWRCNTCLKPVSLAVQATRDGNHLRLHLEQAIHVHMKQHST